MKKVLEELGIGDMPELPNLQEQYDKFMGSPDMKNKEQELITKKGEIDLIDEQIFNMKDEIEAQYSGT